MVRSVSIGKASGENEIGINSEVWSNADGFTKIKILRLLIQLDIDEELAKFGSKDEQMLDPELIPHARVEGFKKFIFHLEQVIGNCLFCIKKGDDEKMIFTMKARLDNVEIQSDKIAFFVENHLTKERTLEIDEEHFNKCFRILRDIKDELNFPINHAGLIFKESEEMDLDAMLEDLVQSG